MTTAQYRCLVAYMSYWQDSWEGLTLEEAMKEVGIDDPVDEVIDQLWPCCWKYDRDTHKLVYDDCDDDE